MTTEPPVQRSQLGRLTYDLHDVFIMWCAVNMPPDLRERLAAEMPVMHWKLFGSDIDVTTSTVHNRLRELQGEDPIDPAAIWHGIAEGRAALRDRKR